MFLLVSYTVFHQFILLCRIGLRGTGLCVLVTLSGLFTCANRLPFFADRLHCVSYSCYFKVCFCSFCAVIFKLSYPRKYTFVAFTKIIPYLLFHSVSQGRESSSISMISNEICIIFHISLHQIITLHFVYYIFILIPPHCRYLLSKNVYSETSNHYVTTLPSILIIFSFKYAN